MPEQMREFACSEQLRKPINNRAEQCHAIGRIIFSGWTKIDQQHEKVLPASKIAHSIEGLAKKREQLADVISAEIDFDERFEHGIVAAWDNRYTTITPEQALNVRSPSFRPLSGGLIGRFFVRCRVDHVRNGLPPSEKPLPVKINNRLVNPDAFTHQAFNSHRGRATEFAFPEAAVGEPDYRGHQ